MKITIEDSFKSGKTTVAALIAKELIKHGAVPTIEDGLDGPLLFTLGEHLVNVASKTLQDKWVTITIVQTKSTTKAKKPFYVP